MTTGVAPGSAPSIEDASPSLLRKVATFGVIGGVATLVHLSIAWILLGPMGGLAANATGFVVALAVTYLGNYFATFKSQAAHGPTLVRFLVVSAATLAVSEWSLVALHSMKTDERVGLVIAVILLPLLRFGLLARQVFVPPDGQTSLREWLVNVGVWSGSIGFGLVALWVLAPAGFLDPMSVLWTQVSHDAGVVGAAEAWSGLADNWLSPVPLSGDPPSSAEVVSASAHSLPLLALAARTAQPLLSNDLNYFPAWFLLAFSAIGPSAVALLRQLSVRSPAVLLGGAALAGTVPALTFQTLHPALSGQFLILLILAAIVGSDRAHPPWAGRAALGSGLVTVALIHPYLLLVSLPFIGGIHAHRLRRLRTTRSVAQLRERRRTGQGRRSR